MKRVSIFDPPGLLKPGKIFTEGERKYAWSDRAEARSQARQRPVLALLSLSPPQSQETKALR